ncbi:MAG TPA: hypothetical protein PK263_06025 [bacterium]|nr:hypothetical protein [bacterium]
MTKISQLMRSKTISVWLNPYIVGDIREQSRSEMVIGWRCPRGAI